jgi:hypothetical protein
MKITRPLKFFRFWYDFVVGDDWVIAAGAAIAIGTTGLLVQRGLSAWWVMPVAVACLLVASIWRETQRASG